MSTYEEVVWDAARTAQTCNRPRFIYKCVRSGEYHTDGISPASATPLPGEVLIGEVGRHSTKFNGGQR
jgi:hypothetical protein